MFERINGLLGGLSRRAMLAFCWALVALVGVLDYATGVQLSLLTFYWVPVSLATWYCGPSPGYPLAAASVIVALGSDWLGGLHSHPFFLLWDAFMRCSSFAIFVFVLGRLRTAYASEAAAKRLSQQAEQDQRATAKLRSDMVSFVSHEYGNMVAGIQMVSQLLGDTESSPVSQERTELYAVLRQGIKYLQVAAANFLDLAKMESGHFAMNIGKARLRTIAHESVHLLRPLLESKDLRVETDFPPFPVPVRGDPEILSIIVTNLIMNAIKYTPNGGAVTVRISVDAGRSQALFCVEDTGMGMTSEQVGRLLAGSAYYRTEQARGVAKGAGVGLMLVQRLIERHDSRLEIDSAPGRGSRFYFRLPLLSRAPQPAEAGVP